MTTDPPCTNVAVIEHVASTVQADNGITQTDTMVTRMEERGGNWILHTDNDHMCNDNHADNNHANHPNEGEVTIADLEEAINDAEERVATIAARSSGGRQSGGQPRALVLYNREANEWTNMAVTGASAMTWLSWLSGLYGLLGSGAVTPAQPDSFFEGLTLPWREMADQLVGLNGPDRRLLLEARQRREQLITLTGVIAAAGIGAAVALSGGIGLAFAPLIIIVGVVSAAAILFVVQGRLNSTRFQIHGMCGSIPADFSIELGLWVSAPRRGVSKRDVKLATRILLATGSEQYKVGEQYTILNGCAYRSGYAQAVHMQTFAIIWDEGYKDFEWYRMDTGDPMQPIPWMKRHRNWHCVVVAIPVRADRRVHTFYGIDTGAVYARRRIWHMVDGPRINDPRIQWIKPGVWLTADGSEKRIEQFHNIPNQVAPWSCGSRVQLRQGMPVPRRMLAGSIAFTTVGKQLTPTGEFDAAGECRVKEDCVVYSTDITTNILDLAHMANLGMIQHGSCEVGMMLATETSSACMVMATISKQQVALWMKENKGRLPALIADVDESLAFMIVVSTTASLVALANGYGKLIITEMRGMLQYETMHTERVVKGLMAWMTICNDPWGSSAGDDADEITAVRPAIDNGVLQPTRLRRRIRGIGIPEYTAAASCFITAVRSDTPSLINIDLLTVWYTCGVVCLGALLTLMQCEVGIIPIATLLGIGVTLTTQIVMLVSNGLVSSVVWSEAMLVAALSIGILGTTLPHGMIGKITRAVSFSLGWINLGCAIRVVSLHRHDGYEWSQMVLMVLWAVSTVLQVKVAWSIQQGWLSIVAKMVTLVPYGLTIGVCVVFAMHDSNHIALFYIWPSALCLGWMLCGILSLVGMSYRIRHYNVTTVTRRIAGGGIKSVSVGRKLAFQKSVFLSLCWWPGHRNDKWSDSSGDESVVVME